MAAERGAGDGELQAASWENPVTNLLKAASEAPGPFSPVPSDSLRVLLRPRICLGLSCLFTPAGRTFPWFRPLLKVLELLASGQVESTELSRKRSRGEAISSKAGSLQSESEDRGGSDQEHNSVAPGRNDSEGSPAAMFPCFSR